MLRKRFLPLCGAFMLGTSLFCSGFGANQNAFAASGGKDVDKTIQRAIQESAKAVIEPEPAPAPEPVIIAAPEPEPEPMPAPAPVIAAPDPIGIRVGGLLFLPSMLAAQGYDDNIYTTDNNTVDDFVTSLQPRLRIEAPDSRHEFVVDGGYEFRKFWDNEDEDRHNFDAKAEGALVGAEWIKFPFLARWQSKHEEREDDLALQLSDKPLRQDDFLGRGGIELSPGRFILGLIGSYQKQRYEDEFSTVNNAQVIRRDADRDILLAEPYLGFKINEAHMLKVSGHYGNRDYERRNFTGTGFDGVKRDSHVFGAMAGWHFDLKNTKGHISAGLSDMNYDDTAIQDIREIVADAAISHYFSENTGFSLQMGRYVEEDEEVVSPIIRSSVAAFLDHSFNDSWLAAAGAEYNYREFNNSARDDDYWKFRAMLDYLFSERLSIGAEYAYSLRDSEAAGLDFDRNQFFVKLRGRI